MAIDDFLVDDGTAPPPTPIPQVHRDGDTTVFEDHVSVHGNFLCWKGGAVLFPYEPALPEDFGQQLNDFIFLLWNRFDVPFGDGTYGAGAVTIQLPWGIFEVTTRIEVPHGFFIQGFGAQYEGKTGGEFQYPGTTLNWIGEPNNWIGAPDNDQTPWKGFCVAFRGGGWSGLSHVRIECTEDFIESPTIEERHTLVTKGRHGVFVGSLDNDGPNARGGPTDQVRLEYVNVINADIGIQHGNTTNMNYNVDITTEADGDWDLAFTSPLSKVYTYTAPVGSSKESIVNGLVEMLNNPYGGGLVPVVEQKVFTFNHGSNFDIVSNTVATIGIAQPPPSASTPAPGGAWTIDDLQLAHINTSKATNLCEFRHCRVAGAGSRSVLLSSANNDLTVFDHCEFWSADICIDIRQAGTCKFSSVICNPRRHQFEAATGVGDTWHSTLDSMGMNFLTDLGVKAGDVLEIYDSGVNDGFYWITEVNDDFLMISHPWPSSGELNQKFRVITSGGIGINVATTHLMRFTVEQYNQERGLIGVKFVHPSEASSSPIRFSQYSCGFPFLILNPDPGRRQNVSFSRPFKFVDSTPHNLVIKATGVNVLLDTCYLPRVGTLVVDCGKNTGQVTTNDYATVKLQNCYESGTRKTPVNGARIIDVGEPSVASLNGRRFRWSVSDTGTTVTTGTREIYLPLDLFFDKVPLAYTRYSPEVSYIGRQVDRHVEGADTWADNWPAQVGSVAQHDTITIDVAAVGEWTVLINGRNYTFWALEGHVQDNIAAGLEAAIRVEPAVYAKRVDSHS